MPGQCISPDAVSNFANKDVNRIQGKIAEVLAMRSPWMNILNGGVIENISDVVRSVVQERAVVHASLAKPVFTTDTEMCGNIGGQDQVGSTEYQYGLQSLRGRGPRVCVKTSRTAFKDSYLRAQQSLEKGILQITNADIRSTLHLRSGVKFVVRTDKDFEQGLTGDMQEIDTQFAHFHPNAPLSFNALYKLGTFLREEMLADPFESENAGSTMFKFIGSVDQIERFRQELQLKEDHRALTTGRYQLGEKFITGYSFEGPYRGFAWGIDQQPLRTQGFDGNGDLVLIEPEIAVVTTKGVGARRNPAWVQAPFEVGFLIAADSFERQTPQSYTGEATFKFAPQLNMGELIWRYIIDNDCNLFGDFGQHVYQISRAYRPVRPQNVIPILYQRCNGDLGLSSCTSSFSGV